MRRILKWIGILLGGLLALIIVVAVVLAITSSSKLNRTYDVEPEAVAVSKDPAVIDRGRYLASVSCAGCHGEDLGGTKFFTDPGLGSIPASNLTAGDNGIGSTYSDVDFVRAIRHGIDDEGKPLAVMPSRGFWYFNDEDVGAIISYLRSLPPVDNNPGEKKFGLMGRLLVGAGMLDILSAEVIDHSASPPEAQTQTVSAAYGEYLVNTSDCRLCHGADLSGGHSGEPGAPPGSNLASVNGWNRDGFITTMRTGVTPDGRQLDPAYMPWKEIGRMTDADLEALFLYISAE